MSNPYTADVDTDATKGWHASARVVIVQANGARVPVCGWTNPDVAKDRVLALLDALSGSYRAGATDMHQAADSALVKAGAA